MGWWKEAVLNHDTELRNKLAKIIRVGHEGLYLRIYVIPKASRLEVIPENDELIMHINESCKRHRVNQGIIKYFKKAFRDKAEVRIIKGKYERTKIIEIRGVILAEAIESLMSYIARE